MLRGVQNGKCPTCPTIFIYTLYIYRFICYYKIRIITYVTRVWVCIKTVGHNGTVGHIEKNQRLYASKRVPLWRKQWDFDNKNGTILC